MEADMSQVEDLLRNLTSGVSVASVNPSTEEHIVIDEDRHVTVPDELKRIAVQYDHNIETVTFDCPRYWDNHDLSTMSIYINYLRADKEPGYALVENVMVNSTDETIIHFDWTVGRHVTEAAGNIIFLVCAKRIDENGDEVNHWNSELNKQMHISEGLECDDYVEETYPDIITDLLMRIETCQNRLLPEVTVADEGSTLRVVNGVWTVVPDVN